MLSKGKEVRQHCFKDTPTTPHQSEATNCRNQWRLFNINWYWYWLVLILIHIHDCIIAKWMQNIRSVCFQSYQPIPTPILIPLIKLVDKRNQVVYTMDQAVSKVWSELWHSWRDFSDKIGTFLDYIQQSKHRRGWGQLQLVTPVRQNQLLTLARYL